MTVSALWNRRLPIRELDEMKSRITDSEAKPGAKIPPHPAPRLSGTREKEWDDLSGRTNRLFAAKRGRSRNLGCAR